MNYADTWNRIIFSEETKKELHSNKQEFARSTGKQNDHVT